MKRPRDSRSVRMRLFAACLLLPLFSTCLLADDESGTQHSDRQALIAGADRIVFLGDSVTYAGQYVAYFDAWLQGRIRNGRPLVLNVGLPSETVSGLSEEGHAGGKFPRPDLAERLQRVLDVTRPNLVFACYGINCGIYQPFNDERFRCYQMGIRRLKQHVDAVGATLVLVTPPSYDDQRSDLAFSYNAVLAHCANWLIEQRAAGWLVVDLHTAMVSEVKRRRATEEEFTFQPDAVHPNADGHAFIASQLIQWFGDELSPDHSVQELLAAQGVTPVATQLVRERLNLLRDAYLTAAGHARPGLTTGLTLKEAQMRAAELTTRIQQEMDD